MKSINILFLIGLFVVVNACHEEPKATSFSDDLALLNTISDMHVLQSGDAMLAVSGSLQGRVFTSSCEGLNGQSLGWFNRNKFMEGLAFQKMSELGGEDRFMFGPEAGPFSMYFKPNTPQEADYIFRQPGLDTTRFTVLEKTDSSLRCTGDLSLINYQNFAFHFNVIRQINLLTTQTIEKRLGIRVNSSLKSVAFSAKTSITNLDTIPWSKESGLLSIWDLSCNLPSTHNTVIIPVKDSMMEVTNYFSELDSTRLKQKNNIVYYKADSDYLNKIGVLSKHAQSVFGSYTPELNLLTIVQYNLAKDSTYVNSQWIEQENPYEGDALNIFNGGYTSDGGFIGPFYEMETSSYAQELKPNECQKHEHIVYHFKGELADLSNIAKQIFGVQIMQPFK